MKYNAVRINARILAVCFLGAVMQQAGCGPGGSSAETAKVSGLVTLDGQPLEQGTLNLIPSGAGQAPPASSPITAGKFSISAAPVGKVTAFVVATKETGKMIPGSSEPVAEVASIIPAQYQSGIELEVTGDTAELNIVLQSK